MNMLCLVLLFMVHNNIGIRIDFACLQNVKNAICRSFWLLVKGKFNVSYTVQEQVIDLKRHRMLPMQTLKCCINKSSVESFEVIRKWEGVALTSAPFSLIDVAASSFLSLLFALGIVIPWLLHLVLLVHQWELVMHFWALAKYFSLSNLCTAFCKLDINFFVLLLLID